MRELYTITSSGSISCLGGITAPITSPIHIEKKDVLSLLNAGHTVYRHNPAKKSEKVLVTFDNVNNIKFGVTTSQATEERILQKAIREEQVKYIAEVHTKETTLESEVETVSTIEETNPVEQEIVEDKVDKKNESEKEHGKRDHKKDKNHGNRLNSPDSFQKS